MKCTRFKSLRNTKPDSTVDLISVLQEIGSSKYRDRILKIRSQENPTKTPLKNYLPLFTPTGVFNHRSIGGLESYNGIVCLDIDNVENPEKLKSICKTLDYVFSSFITPSGQGLKVLIKTNANVEEYKLVEETLANMFLKDTGFCRDNRAKDISRIQFLSYDPEIYINQKSRILNHC